jgi:CheY-like chemotaxis protein
MPRQKANILIVDDDRLIRMTLAAVLGELGYRVHSAQDGFSALAKLRNEIPDIILSDLNMPGMSGFEFLSVVRRRFPAVQTIAMSSCYSGDGVPPGVAADSFYEKGTNLAALLRDIDAMSQPERFGVVHREGALVPIWIPKNGHNPSGKPYVTITCPECLREFAQIPAEASFPVHETGCVHCHSPIHYAIVQPAESASQQNFQPKSDTGIPSPFRHPEFN